MYSKEFYKLKYEIDLVSKGEHNEEFTSIYQRLEELKNKIIIPVDEFKCENCKEEKATHGIGKTKTVCGKCWDIIFFG